MVKSTYDSYPEKPFNFEDYILENCEECKQVPTTLEVIFLNENIHLNSYDSHAQEKCPNLKFPLSSGNLKWVPVKKCTTLTHAYESEKQKTILDITLDIKNWPEFKWECGDTIGVLPRNSDEHVNSLLELLGLIDKADKQCYLMAMPNRKKSLVIPAHIPSPTTPREILKDCLEITAVLKKQFLRSLANYCVNDVEKKFLNTLSSKDGNKFYNDIILKKRFTVLDILQVCKSCQPPLSLLTQHLPRLLPRCYSIASSSLNSVLEFNIIFSVTGVTTKMLQNNPEKVLLYLRKPSTSGSFRYTLSDYNANQILIAIGTGISPYLGFLQHKQYIEQQNKLEHSESNQAGQTWLILGSKTQESVIHRNQILKFLSTNVLNKFTECYSNVLPTSSATSKYQYIQDALRDQSKEFVDLLLQSNTSLYICADGGANVSKSLRACICECLCHELKINLKNAEELVQNLYKENKLREDLWA